jgi:hypothetical protein
MTAISPRGSPILELAPTFAPSHVLKFQRSLEREFMARRRGSVFDQLLVLPWWVAIGLGAFGYAAIVLLLPARGLSPVGLVWLGVCVQLPPLEAHCGPFLSHANSIDYAGSMIFESSRGGSLSRSSAKRFGGEAIQSSRTQSMVPTVESTWCCVGTARNSWFSASSGDSGSSEWGPCANSPVSSSALESQVDSSSPPDATRRTRGDSRAASTSS